MLCEFDSVSDEIHENLDESDRVQHDVLRYVRLIRHSQHNIFFNRISLVGLNNLPYQLSELDPLGVQVELISFELGDVQDV